MNDYIISRTAFKYISATFSDYCIITRIAINIIISIPSNHIIIS